MKKVQAVPSDDIDDDIWRTGRVGIGVHVSDAMLDVFQ
jgi:hypothetical protein